MNSLELVAAHSKFGGFKLSGGGTSSLYVDVKSALLHEDAAAIIDEVYEQAGRLAQSRSPSVFGVGYGGALLVAGLNGRRGLGGCVLRGDAKSYGLGEATIGSARDAVVVVEDVVTTGRSTLIAIHSARQLGHKVLGVVAVVDRTATGGVSRAKVFGSLPVRFLLTEQELRDHLQRTDGQ